MGTWRAAVEDEVVKLEKKLKTLKADGIEVAKLFDFFGIEVPWWGITSNAMIVELKNEDELKNFPTKLLGLLLTKVGKFSRSSSKYDGQVTYNARSEKGLTVSFRIGPAVCKATRVSKKEWKELEDSHYEFQKECDPLFLDEAQREDDLKTDPVSV